MPDIVYSEMMDGYAQEREDLTGKLDASGATISESEQESAGINEFMGLIEKYIDLTELYRAIVHELIEKIVVHKAQKLNGQRTQQIDTYSLFSLSPHFFACTKAKIQPIYLAKTQTGHTIYS